MIIFARRKKERKTEYNNIYLDLNKNKCP